MGFTQLQKDLILGTLLGDANLQSETSGKTWRYRAIHKTAHQSYLFHKYEILQDFCQSPPKLDNFVDPRTTIQSSRYTFQTVICDEFRYYGQLFYKQQSDKSWKKHVPHNIATLLTPRAIAYWYMDDGALKWRGKSNAVRFCTDSFSTDEINLLKNVLETKFFLKVSLQKKDTIQRLCILEESYSILKDLIASYLIPSMYYKFPDGNKGVFNAQDISNDIINRLEYPKDENPYL
jgi:recombination protein RecA